MYRCERHSETSPRWPFMVIVKCLQKQLFPRAPCSLAPCWTNCLWSFLGMIIISGGRLTKIGFNAWRKESPKYFTHCRSILESPKLCVEKLFHLQCSLHSWVKQKVKTCENAQICKDAWAELTHKCWTVLYSVYANPHSPCNVCRIQLGKCKNQHKLKSNARSMCTCRFIKSILGKTNVILVKYDTSSCHAGYEVFCSRHTWHCIPKQLCTLLVKRNALRGSYECIQDKMFPTEYSNPNASTATVCSVLQSCNLTATAILLFFLLYWRRLTRTIGPLLVWAYTKQITVE